MPPPSAPAAPRAAPVWPAVVIVAAVMAVYANTWGAPFQFDDHSSILGNASIRELWPPGWLRPPATAGETVSGRPVLNFTLAVNHAFGGLEVRGYHAVNLLIHAAAALTFWGLLRRSPAAGGGGVAFAAALLWAVHPLHTAAVTYVVQRAESLAGLLGLLALYCFRRGADGPAAAGTRPAFSPRTWFGLAFAAGLLGAGTKETAAMIPVLVLLYDRAFLAGGFRAAWRQRGRVHAALFATWLPLGALILANSGRGGSAGTGVIGAGTYFLTQCAALVRYLALAVWPAGQVFDYGAPVAPGLGAVAPQCLLLAGLAAGVLWLLRRNHPAGFAGAAFFLLLAPSSSFLPVATQTIAEHRMYLPLAPLLALACAAVPRRHPVALGVLAGGVAVALGAATFARNEVYRSALALWADTVAHRPDNPRARYNLGLALAAAGRPDEAAAEFRHTLALQPAHAFAHFELGEAALLAGRWEEAVGRFEAALQADPRLVDARVNLGQALVHLGREEEALTHYRRALADDPGASDIRVNLASLLIGRGAIAEGTTLLREAIALTPDLAEAHLHLGLALVKAGDPAGEAELGEAVRLKPGLAAGHHALGGLRAGRGDLVGAEAAYREALRLDDAPAATWFALGNLLARQQRFLEATAAYRAAVARAPSHVEARGNLANSLLVTGRIQEAIAEYEAILRVHPADARVRENLRLAREALDGR